MLKQAAVTAPIHTAAVASPGMSCAAVVPSSAPRGAITPQQAIEAAQQVHMQVDEDDTPMTDRVDDLEPTFRVVATS
jgi:hypothetical protein